jgi:hypothetical protein
MNNKFDELTKAMAQSVTRRQAFKKFGLGLAGMVLACFGLANRAEAGPKKYGSPCATNADCSSGFCNPLYHTCGCVSDKDCPGKHTTCYPNGLCFGPIA